MTHKHTLGPWHKSSTGNHQGLVISEVTGANVAVTYDEKDADLVAASAEMFEVLNRVESATYVALLTQNYGSIPAMLEDVRSVINKAKGQPK